MQALSFEVERVNGADAAVVRAEGYIDTHTASQLETLLAAQLETGSTLLLLDLSAVDYVSSAGWGVLISTVRHARRLGGDLRLIGMQEEVREVFVLLEFPSILQSHGTLEEALAGTKA